MEKTDQEFKNILIRTFQAFDTFCREHEINYFAAYGTLIGAIRHKGLIPWDDDIDVWMMPDDYKKFCAFRGKVEGHYDILDSRDDGYWLFDLAKFVDTTTTLWEYPNHPCVTGVYIDVFPLAECNYEEGLPLKLSYQKLSYLVERAMMKHSLHELFTIVKSHNYRELKFFIYDIVCMPFMKRVWKTKYNQCLCRIKNSQGDKYISYESMYRERDVFEKKWFSKSIKTKFEDMTISIPSGYDALLKHIYGDYMTLPPEEKRASHHTHYFLDLHRRWTIEEIKEYKKCQK